MGKLLLAHTNEEFLVDFPAFLGDLVPKQYDLLIARSVAEALSTLSLGGFDKIFLSSSLPLHEEGELDVKDVVKFTKIISQIMPELEIFIHTEKTQSHFFPNLITFDRATDFDSLVSLLGIESELDPKEWRYEELLLVSPEGYVSDSYGLNEPESRGDLLESLKQQALQISQGLGEVTLGKVAIHGKTKSCCASLDRRTFAFGLIGSEAPQIPQSKHLLDKFKNLMYSP